MHKTVTMIFIDPFATPININLYYSKNQFDSYKYIWTEF